MVGGSDVLLGELEGCPFYMGEDQFAYWEHTQLIIDVVPGRDPGKVFQDDTLVLPRHRGHRLGLALKVANLRAVQRAHPDRRVLHTWNAEENGPMVAVNNAMGFRPVERLGEYQRDL